MNERDELARIDRDVQRLRDWRHEVEPDIRSLLEREKIQRATVERITDALEELTKTVTTMAHQEEIANAVADEVERRAKVTAEELKREVQKERQHWLGLLNLPQKVLVYVGVTVGTVAVIVNAVVQLVRFWS